MMRSHVALAVALVVVVCAPAARAQVDARAVSFGIGGGSSFPVSDARDAYRTGFNGGAFLRLDLGALPLALRADCTYQNFELRSAAIPAVGSPGGGTGTLLGGLGDAVCYLRRGGLRPYLIAGFGAYALRTEYDAAGLATTTETRLGAHGGLGVLLTFGSLELYAEGTLDHVLPRSGARTGSSIQVVPMTMGVIF
jgi:hypothetical protein